MSALLASPLAVAQKVPIPTQLRAFVRSYGEMADDPPEIEKAGCLSIDIWRRKHGNQREQIWKWAMPPARAC